MTLLGDGRRRRNVSAGFCHYYILPSILLIFILLVIGSLDAFTTSSSRSMAGRRANSCLFKISEPGITGASQLAVRAASSGRNRHEEANETSSSSEKHKKAGGLSLSVLRRLRSPSLRIPPLRSVVGRKVRPVALAFLTAATLTTTRMTPQSQRTGHYRFPSIHPPEAHASAPLALPPAYKQQDPLEAANEAVQKRREKQQAQEFVAHQKKLMQIENEQGVEARKKYEKEYEAEQERKAAEKQEGLQKLKYELLDKGMCPFVDPEGVRQIYLYKNDFDLADEPGTVQAFEADMQESDPQGYARKWGPKRFIVRCIVEDLKQKGDDPVEYFQKNQEKTMEILTMEHKSAVIVASRYRKNLQQYGSIVPPKEGEETAAKKTQAGRSEDTHPEINPQQALKKGKEAEKAKAAQAKEERRKAKEEAKASKAKVKEETRKLKQEAKAAKAKLKEEARAAKAKAKEEAKSTKEAAKKAAAGATAAAAAAARHAAQDAETAATAGMDFAATAGREAVSPSTLEKSESREGAGAEQPSEDAGQGPQGPILKDAVAKKKKESPKGKLPIVPAAKIVAVAGVGGFAYKYLQDKAARDEKERQRQFKLIMGMDEDEEDDEDDEDADDLTGGGSSTATPGDATVSMDETTSKTDKPEPSPPAKSEEAAPSTPVSGAPSPPKKRRMGLKSMFRKSGSARETDLNALLTPDAKAPEFASLLAKILTYGAPGRFPQVTALPGGMPMEEFDLEKAKEILSEAREASGMTDGEAAEEFATVVNCMIIDIIDLASSTLKEKEDKVTIDALNVVMDFMDHAASLFDAVAEGVSITPVTYGGTLGKGKLEQMYSIYAAASLGLDGEGPSQDRIDTLQQVLNISDKKAEGLLQKQMMKNLMEMMKDGKGLEGLSEMMGGMEGGGLPGLGGEDEEVSPETVKQSLMMMKEMLDSGAVSKEDMKAVREQFKEAYGQNIEELIAEAEKEGGEMSEEEQELLDLMKSVLKED